MGRRNFQENIIVSVSLNILVGLCFKCLKTYAHTKWTVTVFSLKIVGEPCACQWVPRRSFALNRAKYKQKNWSNLEVSRKLKWRHIYRISRDCSIDSMRPVCIVLHNNKNQQMFKKTSTYFIYIINYHIYIINCPLKNVYTQNMHSLKICIHRAKTHRLYYFIEWADINVSDFFLCQCSCRIPV